MTKYILIAAIFIAIIIYRAVLVSRGEAYSENLRLAWKTKHQQRKQKKQQVTHDSESEDKP